jgi:hypothetical protein
MSHSNCSRTYTAAHLEQVDRTVVSLMGTISSQEAIDLLIPDDPPRDPNEYAQACWFFLGQALGFNPSETVPLLHLGNWARVCVLEFALGDFTEAHAYLVSLMKDGCMFHDDALLFSATKLVFGLAAFFLAMGSPVGNLRFPVDKCKHMLTSSEEECFQKHSRVMLRLCAEFFTLLEDLLEILKGKGSEASANRSLAQVLMTAKRIDDRTRNRFRTAAWVKDIVKQYEPSHWWD